MFNQIEREIERPIVASQAVAPLRSRFTSIERAIAGGARNALVVRDQLEALRAGLFAQFRSEEDDGFFSEIAQQDVRFIGDAASLQHQHVAMLETLDCLIDQVVTVPPQWWSDVEFDFAAFREGVLRHESSEQELLQKAYLARHRLEGLAVHFNSFYANSSRLRWHEN